MRLAIQGECRESQSQVMAMVAGSSIFSLSSHHLRSAQAVPLRPTRVLRSLVLVLRAAGAARQPVFLLVSLSVTRGKSENMHKKMPNLESINMQYSLFALDPHSAAVLALLRRP